MLPVKQTSFPRIHIGEPLVISSRRSPHRGQHSPGVRICFVSGHCSTGQDFLVQVSLWPAQVHLTHGSSLSVASPSTFWPFSWHPASEMGRERAKRENEHEIPLLPGGGLYIGATFNVSLVRGVAHECKRSASCVSSQFYESSSSSSRNRRPGPPGCETQARSALISETERQRERV